MKAEKSHVLQISINSELLKKALIKISEARKAVMKLKNIIIFVLLINLFFLKQSFSQDIPVIVIAPGKTPQSLNTVGSSVTVIDGNKIQNSSGFTLAEIIDGNSTSVNMFQMGGHGGNTAIQLRGLEKRYSTVYID